MGPRRRSKKQSIMTEEQSIVDEDNEIFNFKRKRTKENEQNEERKKPKMNIQTIQKEMKENKHAMTLSCLEPSLNGSESSTTPLPLSTPLQALAPLQVLAPLNGSPPLKVSTKVSPEPEALSKGSNEKDSEEIQPEMTPMVKESSENPTEITTVEEIKTVKILEKPLVVAKEKEPKKMKKKKKRSSRMDEMDEKILSTLTGDAYVLYERLCTILTPELKEARTKYCGSQRVYYTMLEIGCQMIKAKVVDFLKTKDPKTLLDMTPNPVNVALQAELNALKGVEAQLIQEQEKWEHVLKEAQSFALTSLPENNTIVPTTSPALLLGQECSDAMQDVFSKLAHFPAQIAVLDSSTKSMDRLMLAATVARDEALQAFHAHAFKSYPSVSQPKSLVQALLLSSASSSTAL